MTVCDPRLGVVQEGRQYHGAEDVDFCGFLQVLAAPDTTVESAESTFFVANLLSTSMSIFASEEMVHPTKVGELLDSLQFCLTNSNVGWAVRFLGGRLMKNLCFLQADFETEELGCLCEARCYALQGIFSMGYKGGIVSKK